MEENVRMSTKDKAKLGRIACVNLQPREQQENARSYWPSEELKVKHCPLIQQIPWPLRLFGMITSVPL